MARNNTPNQKNWRACTTHCAYCERKLYDTGQHRRTIDHFYPLDVDKKHLNRAWNKVVCCHRCNLIKSNKMPQKFIDNLQQRLDSKVVYPADYRQDMIDIIKNVSRYQDELESYFIMRDLI